MYKIETHLHTKHTSKCGWMTAPELIAGYKAAGYDAIIVTDHYNRTTFDYLGVDTTAPGNKVKPFLEGFYRMAELGEKEGIRVFKGAELRFDESDNDYLLFGYRDDLLAEPEDIFRMGIAGFSPIARGRALCWCRPIPTGRSVRPPSPAIWTAWRPATATPAMRTTTLLRRRMPLSSVCWLLPAPTATVPRTWQFRGFSPPSCREIPLPWPG